MDKDQVYGWYANENRTIKSSSESEISYQKKQYRRKGNMEDPWIGLENHPQGILYGENNWGGPNQPHSKLNSSCGGALVFIKIDNTLNKLTAKDFGFDSLDRKFEVKDKYVWTTQEFTLPIKVELSFTFKKTSKPEAEFFTFWSQNKSEWG